LKKYEYSITRHFRVWIIFSFFVLIASLMVITIDGFQSGDFFADARKIKKTIFYFCFLFYSFCVCWEIYHFWLFRAISIQKDGLLFHNLIGENKFVKWSEILSVHDIGIKANDPKAIVYFYRSMFREGVLLKISENRTLTIFDCISDFSSLKKTIYAQVKNQKN